MPEYIRGLEKGLSILRDVKESDFDISFDPDVDKGDIDIPVLFEMILDMVRAYYMHEMETEKVKILDAR